MGIWIFLQGFLRSRAGKYALIGLSAALFLAGVYWHGRRAGHRAGEVDGAKRTFDTLGEQMKQDRQQFSATLASISGLVARQNAIIDAQNSQIAARDARITQIEQRRKDTAGQIAQMTDAEAFLDLTQRLAVRAPQDKTAALYPGEIRKADTVVADYALQGQKVAELSGKVEAMQGKIGALEQKSALTEQKFNLALDYIDRSDERFKTAYNVFNEIHGRPWWQKVLTFGILKNKKIQRLEPITPLARPRELSR